jgi:hypothetical protein
MLAAGQLSMEISGLDNRHSDKAGEISRKHGNTLVRTLRKIYGAAPGFSDNDRLSDVLQRSQTQLRRDHDMGTLEGKIARHS